MKLTKAELKQLIQEELQQVMQQKQVISEDPLSYGQRERKIELILQKVEQIRLMVQTVMHPARRREFER